MHLARWLNLHADQSYCCPGVVHPRSRPIRRVAIPRCVLGRWPPAALPTTHTGRPTSRANSIVGTGSSKVGMGSPGIRFWDLGPHEVLHLPELLIHNKVIIGKYFTPYNDRFRHSCRLQTVLLQSYGCMGCLLGGWVGKTEIKKFRKISKKSIFSKFLRFLRFFIEKIDFHEKHQNFSGKFFGDQKFSKNLKKFKKCWSPKIKFLYFKNKIFLIRVFFKSCLSGPCPIPVNFEKIGEKEFFSIFFLVFFSSESCHTSLGPLRNQVTRSAELQL